MAKKNKTRQIPEVLVFTDTNHYTDALASRVVLSWLEDRRLIKIRGVITEVGSYETRRRRAMYAKGALVLLKQPFLRVVPGGDYLPVDEAEENTYPETPWTPVFENLGTSVLRSGTIFLQEYIKSAPSKNVYILLNAPFADLMKYIRTAGAALAKKLKKIVVMGSVLPQKDENGHTQPDETSYNFKVCAPAGAALFEYARTYGIRLTVVTADAVKSASMAYEFLDGVETSKNPVVRQLIEDKSDNPVSMRYDMISALATADNEFKRSGGTFETDSTDSNLAFAKVIDSDALKEKLITIFKDKFEPKKITLAHLCRTNEDADDHKEPHV
jgi:hypothetical protein